MSPIQQFRKKLSARRLCLGPGIMFNDPAVTEAIGDAVDYFWIDLEHTAMDRETMQGHLIAARAVGVPALVRVPLGRAGFIKPVLDSGADGIIIPQVRSADEAREAVAECRYPPMGRRGFGPRRAARYGQTPMKDYFRQAQEDLFVVVQVESVGALNDLDRILEIPGLDSIVIGPYDLSGSMGLLGKISHPKVAAALDTIIAKTLKSGLFIGVGMGMNDLNFARRMAGKGVHWLQIGCDYEYLVCKVRESQNALRTSLSRSHARNKSTR